MLQVQKTLIIALKRPLLHLPLLVSDEQFYRLVHVKITPG
jgi:hypothetical protein